MAKVKEVDCSQVEQTDEIGGGVDAGGCRGSAMENRPRSKAGFRQIREPRGPRERSLFSSPLPHPVMLTVPQSGGLQSPKQLSADVFAVPARLGQGLGHCKVKGIQIIAGVRVSSRAAIR